MSVLNDPLLHSTSHVESQYPPDSVEGYAHLLQQVLLDGTVSPGERRLIEEHREQNRISIETHQMALQSLGWTEENWEAAIDMGKESLPDEIYGGPRCPQVHYIPKLHEKEKPIYAHGLIVAPHLRQWYTFSATGAREMFWREKEERKASPLELFLDLCFVTTVYKLSHAMENQPFSTLIYCILYCAFWRVWVGITTYSTRYEHEDWLHPLAYCTTMLGALFMTSEIQDTYGLLSGHLDSPNIAQLKGFAFSFIFANFPLFVLYVIATITELSGRAKFIVNINKQNLNRRTTYHPLHMLIALSISLIPWIITAATQTQNPLPYWGASILFMEIATRIIDSHNFWTAPICVEHWGERFSLFVMLHLGESMFAIASDPVGTNSVLPLVGTMFGLIIPFAFRRVYFEVEGAEPKDPHALRRWFTLQIYTLTHLFLCMAIIAYAIGLSGLQTVSNEELQGRDLQIPYYTQLDALGQLKPFNWSPGEEANTTLIANITCSETFTDLQLYYIFRDNQALFCRSLAVMMLMVAVQTLLSKTEEEYEKKYFLARSQYWRVGIRLIFFIVLFVIPAIRSTTNTVSAFDTICIGGTFYFVWALVESFFVLKNTAHKHLLRHDPHYVEMLST